MTATISPPQAPPVQVFNSAEAAPKPECICSSSSPQRRLWTRAEFERLADAGIFGPEERLELIEGEIVVTPPCTPPHAVGISLAWKALIDIRPDLLHTRIRMPLCLNDFSQPEPDIAVVAGSIRDYAQAHPTTAVLIVEISDTTLAYDRRTKTGLYARAGVAEYWIVNLVDRVLEVHRQPAPMTDMPIGHGYRSVVQYTAEQTVSPLAAPAQAVAVAALLP